MESKILITVGPSSLKKDIIKDVEKENIYLFRINMSHTPIDSIEATIAELQGYTSSPICIDSEGAQIRNQSMKSLSTNFEKNTVVKIHNEEIIGDSENISFHPSHVVKQLQVGDLISVDFDSVVFRVIEKNKDYCLANVEISGVVGNNKAANFNRSIELDPITKKDMKAIEIARDMGISNFALSFANSSEDVVKMRDLVGNQSKIISKIESRSGLRNLNGILKLTDEVLIDRGDLSREVDLVKIPFFQRRIISTARSNNTPVYVATNLHESMIKNNIPTRAEINDVVSTLLMGANGLVLAAETAIGNYPVEAVQSVRKLITQFERWTPNTSIEELLQDN